MGLYVCDECGSVENTALARYWMRNFKEGALANELNGAALCSACDPEIGRWHGRFPRKPWDGKTKVKNPPQRQRRFDEALEVAAQGKGSA